MVGHCFEGDDEGRQRLQDTFSGVVQRMEEQTAGGQTPVFLNSNMDPSVGQKGGVPQPPAAPVLLMFDNFALQDKAQQVQLLQRDTHAVCPYNLGITDGSAPSTL